MPPLNLFLSRQTIDLEIESRNLLFKDFYDDYWDCYIDRAASSALSVFMSLGNYRKFR